MTPPTDSSSGGSGNWLFKNKDHGKTSAAASLVCFCTLYDLLRIQPACSKILTNVTLYRV